MKRYSLKKFLGALTVLTMLFIAAWITVFTPEYLRDASSILFPLGVTAAALLGLKSAANLLSKKIDSDTGGQRGNTQ